MLMLLCWRDSPCLRGSRVSNSEIHHGRWVVGRGSMTSLEVRWTRHSLKWPTDVARRLDDVGCQAQTDYGVGFGQVVKPPITLHPGRGTPERQSCGIQQPRLFPTRTRLVAQPSTRKRNESCIFYTKCPPISFQDALQARPLTYQLPRPMQSSHALVSMYLLRYAYLPKHVRHY